MSDIFTHGPAVTAPTAVPMPAAADPNLNPIQVGGPDVGVADTAASAGATAEPITPAEAQAARIAHLEAQIAATERIAELEAALRDAEAKRQEAAVIEPVKQEDIYPLGQTLPIRGMADAVTWIPG